MATMDWAHFDEDGTMRQSYLDIDDRTDDLKDLIEASQWSWEEFQEMYNISWIYHENGLEGVVLTYPEIKSAVDNKIVSDVSLLPMYRHVKTQKWCIDQVRDKLGADAIVKGHAFAGPPREPGSAED